MRTNLRFAAAFLSAAIITVGMGVLAPAAQAAGSGSTDATFTISSGTLDISVPASTVDLTPSGGITTGAGTFSHLLGQTSVSDTRGLLVASWTASVTSTSFTTGTAAGPSPTCAAGPDCTNQTVAAPAIAYAAGAGTNDIPGNTTGLFTGLTAAALSSSVGSPVATFVAGTGKNGYHWNPNLTFTLLPTQVAGVYNGTITQSVS